MYYWRTGISERTYNARICALKLIFKILLKTENPFAEIRHKTELQQSRKAFTAEQLKTIFAKLEEPDYYMLFKDEMRLMILIMLYTGCRGGDACTMQWKAVNLANRSFVFIPRKTARHHPQAVHIPMAELLFHELQILSSKRSDSDFVLPQVADRYLRNPSGISTDIGKLLKAAGIITQGSTEGLHRKRAVVEYSMHSFRHTFCSMAANAGIDLSVIRAMVGHTQTAMTEHYTHYSIEAKRKAIEALPLPVSKTPYSDEASIEDLICKCGSGKLHELGKFLSETLSSKNLRQLRILLQAK
jgi:integrase